MVTGVLNLSTKKTQENLSINYRSNIVPPHCGCSSPPRNENKPTPTQRQLSKKLLELVDRENLDPRRSFTKKQYWNQQHFQSEINPEERQLRLRTKTRQNPSIL